MTAAKPDILFVDDDVNILRAFGRLLRGKRDDWNLVFVDSGEKALAEADKYRFKVMVTDLCMPGMPGLELVRELNQRSPQTKCIILSGTADLQTAAEIINSVRVFRFYTKPCETNVLIDGIAVALSEPDESTGPNAVQDDGPGNQVLDRLLTGVLVVSVGGEVIYLNQSAAEAIAEEDGLSIGYDQILRTSIGAESRKLKAALHKIEEAADEDQVVALSLERPSLREALKVILAPIQNTENDSVERVIVFISDPEKGVQLSPEMIARLFGLTPSESRLARELIEGRKIEEIAVTLGITVSSARTYLKRIMEKTGTNRQADLVRYLLSAPQVVTPMDKAMRQG